VAAARRAAPGRAVVGARNERNAEKEDGSEHGDEPATALAPKGIRARFSAATPRSPESARTNLAASPSLDPQHPCSFSRSVRGRSFRWMHGLVAAYSLESGRNVGVRRPSVHPPPG
jgi:hypothetical protein